MKLIFESLDNNKVAVREGVMSTIGWITLSSLALAVFVTDIRDKNRIKKYGHLMKQAVSEYINSTKADSYILNDSMFAYNTIELVYKYKLWTYEDALKFSAINSSEIKKEHVAVLNATIEWANDEKSRNEDDIYGKALSILTNKDNVPVHIGYNYKWMLYMNKKTREVILFDIFEDLDIKNYSNYSEFIDSITLPLYDYLVSDGLINKVY